MPVSRQSAVDYFFRVDLNLHSNGWLSFLTLFVRGHFFVFWFSVNFKGTIIDFIQKFDDPKKLDSDNFAIICVHILLWFIGKNLINRKKYQVRSWWMIYQRIIEFSFICHSSRKYWYFYIWYIIYYGIHSSKLYQISSEWYISTLVNAGKCYESFGMAYRLFVYQEAIYRTERSEQNITFFGRVGFIVPCLPGTLVL